MNTTVLRSIVVAAALTALSPPQVLAQGEPAPVRVDAVQSEQVQQRRMVTGNVRAVTRSNLAAIEPGLVVSLPVREGQHVTQGEEIATLDDSRLTIQHRQIESQRAVQESLLNERDAQVQLRESDLAMLQEAEQRGAVNPKELSDARSELAVAIARREAAQGELTVIETQIELLRQRIDDMIVTAPFDGIVVSRHSAPGQWVGEGDAIVEMISTGQYDIWLDVPQHFARALSGESLELPIYVEALDRTYVSEQVRFVSDIDMTARTFVVIARVNEAGESKGDDRLMTLSPGMSVTAAIPTGNVEQRLTVHKDAILRNESGPYVYVVHSGGEGQSESVVAAPINVLFELAERVVVADGSLKADDRVVVEGNERLMPMSPVRVVQPTQGRGSERTADAADSPT